MPVMKSDNLNMKKMLVTGGAGFIGSEFIDYTLNKYDDVFVLCFDKLTYAGQCLKNNRFSSFKNFKFVKGDICDNGAIERLFDEFKFDVAVNFAAESHVDRSINSPQVFFETNLLGTTVLLEAARKYNVKRFHQISTDEVYGGAFGKAFTESDRLNPSSPYSASKAAADLACLSYAKTFGLNVTITRSANNYGRFQYPEKLIPVAICSALCGKKIPLYGAGESIRDWLYVTDNCKAIDAVINYGAAGEIYNIAGGCRLKNGEVIRKILALLGESEDLIEYVPDRPGRDLEYRIDDGKLKNIYDEPKTDFDAGLKATVEWYKNNKDWWQPLFLK